MKAWKIGVACIVAVVLLGSCALGLFGPNKNKVLQWLPKFEETSRISYRETFTTTSSAYESGNFYQDYTYTMEILDIEERDTKTVFTVDWDGGDHYFIGDDTREQLVSSENDTIDDSDQIMLEAPIEVGTRWTGMLRSYILEVEWSDARFSIDSVDETRSAGVETATDVVKVDIDFDDDNYFDMNGDGEDDTVLDATIFYSPTYGFLGDYYRVRDANGDTWTFETTVTDVDQP